MCLLLLHIDWMSSHSDCSQQPSTVSNWELSEVCCHKFHDSQAIADQFQSLFPLVFDTSAFISWFVWCNSVSFSANVYNCWILQLRANVWNYREWERGVFASLTHFLIAARGFFCVWSVCEYMHVCMCMCLCTWCMKQWVSWVCWWCLPKLQRGWHFSTNPASLEGAPYPNHSVFFPPMQAAIISQSKKTGTDCALLQTEINLLDSPERFHANALPTTKCHASANSFLSSFCLTLSFGLFLSFFFCLSFSLSISHNPHLSAALHCWRQQPGSPLYFWAPQIDTGW